MALGLLRDFNLARHFKLVEWANVMNIALDGGRALVNYGISNFNLL